MTNTLPLTANPETDDFVFVCYSHMNRDEVFSEISALNKCGFKVWFDDGIEAGSEWSASIAKAIQKCKAVVYFVSPQSVESEPCRREINFALEESKEILAVHLTPTEVPAVLRLSLSHRQAILKHSDSAYQQKLTNRLADITGYTRPQAAEMVAPRSTEAGSRSPKLFLGAAAAFIIGAVALYFALVPEEQDWEWPWPDSFNNGIAFLPPRVEGLNPNDVMEAERFVREAYQVLVSADTILPFIDSKLRVVSNRDAKIHVDAGRTSAELGEILDVGYLLDSQAARQSSGLAITTNLTRAWDSQLVWSYTYMLGGQIDLPFQPKPVQHLKNNLEYLAVRDRGNQFVRENQDYESEARALVVRGWESYLSYTSGGMGDWRIITDSYRRALEIDPTIPLAHYLLINAYRTRAGVDIPVNVARTKAQEIIDLAGRYRSANEDVDLLLQTAEISLHLDLNFSAAEADLLRMLELQPTTNWAHYFLAAVAMARGEVAKANGYLNQAERISHLAGNVTFFRVVARMYYNLGRYEDAIRVSQKGLSISDNPQLAARALISIATSLHQLGRVAEAHDALEQAWSMAGELEPELFVMPYAMMGNHEKAHLLAKHLDIRHTPFAGPMSTDEHYFFLARAYAALGEQELAIAELRKGIEHRDMQIVIYLRAGAEFDALREHPDYADLLAYFEEEERKGQNIFTHSQHPS